MIDLIPDLPADVLGFSAKGTVTADDYESILVPAVEAHFSSHPKARLLYHAGEEFTGYKAAAAWDDAKVGLKHLGGWERIAVVSNIEWMRVACKVLGLAMPGHVRVFHNEELDDAIRWLSE